MLKGWLKTKDRRGQTLVEFALILPIFLLLLLGIIQFGMVFSAQLIVSNASRDGARTAAVKVISNDNLKTEVVGKHSIITIKKDDIIIVYTPGTRTSGGSVEVTVSYPVTIFVPTIDKIKIIPVDANKKYTVTAKTTMYIE